MTEFDNVHVYDVREWRHTLEIILLQVAIQIISGQLSQRKGV